MEYIEQIILTKLPLPIAKAVKEALLKYSGMVEEIRLRANRPIALTLRTKLLLVEYVCTPSDLENAVLLLCNHSLYSYADTIREGYIPVAAGIRAGICGQAVLNNREISVLKNISSICIRLPHRVPHAADQIIDALERKNYTENVLIFGPPGTGKTTVLRELTAALTSMPIYKKVALIDTRHELSVDLDDSVTIDVLSGYPRSKGMEIALRTLAPEYIICDEIASESDQHALLECGNCGVHLCASIHASTLQDLRANPALQKILVLFQWFYQLDNSHHGTLFPSTKELVG